ncbi:uncharacterized protein LOC109714403 isoform X2 [Ananas comosus]|uniref:Uncharacterized protein LOC109714403 isoform X2 n=1 Tax=Ananas comosus TaxID=4615 RepID=A0A6P5FF75_ANACO|nr:uncharacterized protein LOC109714403 isoform X2 [Ananas comosus]
MEFITEMGVVLRQYAPLNVNKWAEVPMHYKDKMWDDLMRMSEQNKANRAKQSTSSICVYKRGDDNIYIFVPPCSQHIYFLCKGASSSVPT